MSEIKNKTQLIHRPLGFEHPYQPEPYERFPRHPKAGEKVSLGVETHSDHTIDRVWAVWQCAGQQHEAEGKQVGGASDHPTWQIELPAFSAGDTVDYQIFAKSGDEVIFTEHFSFAVRFWLPVSKFISAEISPSGSLFVAARDEEGSQKVGFEYSINASGQLLVSFSAGEYHTGENALALELIRNDDQLLIAGNSCVQVHISKTPFKMSITNPYGKCLLAEQEPAAFLTDATGKIFDLRQRFASPAHEAFWGFGERFNALDQRGQSLDVRVFEEYKNQGKRTYLPMPLFVSSNGYGVHLNTERYVWFDLAETDVNAWTFEAELGPDEKLDYHLLFGQPLELVSKLTQKTGKAVLPPKWTFGLWMSGNEWNTQARVEEMVFETTRHEIPATVLVIEAWSDESTFYIWNDAVYEAKPSDQPLRLTDFTFPEDGMWPDPKQMIDDLHARGIRLILWQIPVLKNLNEPHPQHEIDQAYMLEQEYYVKDKNGAPYKVKPFWFHKGMVMDFTNQEGADWWMNKRDYLLTDMGIDGFKTDGGEHIWGRDLQFSNGQSGDEVWNTYPNRYVGAYNTYARSKNPEAITFSRAGYTGAQQFPTHWAGDENSTWQAFQHSIIAGLTAGVSGISFWGWDIGGFSKDLPTSELYLRSTAMAAFCPIMQYHSEYFDHKTPCHDRTPWNIQEQSGDERVIPIFRDFANLRMNLLPYILREAWKSSESGLPMMVALSIACPEDLTCREYPYQYFFGEDLLVAPVVQPDQTRWPVYLPEGVWFDFWTGEQYSGKQVVDYPVPMDRIPVFVREGAVLPLNLGHEMTLCEPVGNAVDEYKNLCVRIYPGKTTQSSIFDARTDQPLELPVRFDADQQTLEVDLPGMEVPINLLVVCNKVNGIEVDGKDAADLSSRRNGELIISLPSSSHTQKVRIAGLSRS
jgi:alpha-glucosidase (family GH31 glycosyl hydrolase)